MSNNGWYFGYVPKWVVAHFDPHKDCYTESQRQGYREPLFPHEYDSSIEEFLDRVKGRYYEYCEVVLRCSHTHESAIVKRKLHHIRSKYG